MAQPVRVLSPHAKTVGTLPGQGTYQDQPVNASINACLASSLSLPQKSIKCVEQPLNPLPSVTDM